MRMEVGECSSEEFRVAFDDDTVNADICVAVGYEHLYRKRVNERLLSISSW